MTNCCLTLPFLPGRIELTKKFVQENASSMEHNEFYRSAGISREQLWIQRAPTGSGAPDLAIVSIETNDPAQTLKEFATSNHSWAVKFLEFAKKLTLTLQDPHHSMRILSTGSSQVSLITFDRLGE
jgi:hypothetical protein